MPFCSEIKLARSLDFGNMTTISEPWALHSVQLPLWKGLMGGRILKRPELQPCLGHFWVLGRTVTLTKRCHTWECKWVAEKWQDNLIRCWQLPDRHPTMGGHNRSFLKEDKLVWVFFIFYFYLFFLSLSLLLTTTMREKKPQSSSRYN